jgi:antitoxin component YwqK of YwqJK toxin-antitoxin module
MTGSIGRNKIEWWKTRHTGFFERDHISGFLQLNHYRNSWCTVMRYLLSFFIVPAVIALLLSEPAMARKDILKQDTNEDGLIDQIAHFDKRGKIIKLEIDSNADEVMDRFQYYEKEQIIKVERDTDHDRQIDCRDYFEAGKRVRQERSSTDTGLVNQVIQFDPEERPLKIRKDTTGDGLFDSFYHFKEGKLSLSTKDTDSDGKPNIWQTYQDDKPLQRSVDDDGDGQVERITLYDAEGLPKESRHDLDRDGKMDAFRSYRQGVLFDEKKDLDHDGIYEIITRFKDDQPIEQQKDANKDGRFDIITQFRDGKPYYQEKDTNFDEKKDVFIHFDADGYAERIEEDTRHIGRIDRIRTYHGGLPVKVVYDADNDGFKEVITLFKDGKACRQTEDRNQDGKPDITIFFNAKEEKQRVESDTNLNGRIDTWEYYKDGRLLRVEKDEEGNGKISLKIFYKNEQKYRLIRDKDGDGRFEITQWFNRPQWSMVMEVDTDGDKKPEGRYCYKESVLRLKEIDEDSDGDPDLIEHYNAKGKLTRSQEKHEAADRMDTTWFYNEAEEAIRAEKDHTGDGCADTWYYYDKGNLTSVEEDTNADGKPDIWEEYDESEALVRRSKDLNFDGKPDLVEDRTGEGG